MKSAITSSEHTTLTGMYCTAPQSAQTSLANNSQLPAMNNFMHSWYVDDVAEGQFCKRVNARFTELLDWTSGP